jgi:hypothetical protein
VAVAAVACRPDGPAQSAATKTETAPSTAAPAPPTAPTAANGPARFVATVDNPFLPLVPGTRFTYQSRTPDGLERTVVEVTRDTRTITGAPCVVVRDTVTRGGQPVEDTVDWFAQDGDGNVWYFGEDTKEYENGRVARTEGSWEAGVDGAQPGIVMEAHPKVGDTYRQEYYRGHAEDRADVLSLTATATVPFGAQQDLVQTKDYTPLEPDVVEHKYYARGVGLVLEVDVRGGTGRVELVSVEHV